MSGEIELLSKRRLSAVVGVNNSGVAALQETNKSLNLVGLYGDSLVAQQTMDPAFKLRRPAYNSINIANALAGQRMAFVLKKAVSGERSDQTLQRLVADASGGILSSSGVGTIIFSMGTNDVAQNAYNDVVSGAAVTLANVAENIATNAARFIDLCASLGIQCIFRTIHGASNYNAAMIAAMEDTNRRIQALCRGRRGVWLLETRDALRNPLTTSPSAITFRAGAMMVDQPGPVLVHEAVPGAYALGKKLADIVKAAIPALPLDYVDGAGRYSASWPAQLVTNPEFAGGGGTLAAGGTLGKNAQNGDLASVPSGWTVKRRGQETTTTFTVNVGEDEKGRYMELVINAAAANGGVWLQQEVNASATKVAAGEAWQMFSSIEVLAGHSNLGGFSPSFDFNFTKNAVNASHYGHGCNQPGTGVGNYGVFPGEAMSFEDATEPLIVPAYDTIGWLVCRAADVIFMGAGTATIRVRQPRFERVAAIPAVAA